MARKKDSGGGCGWLLAVALAAGMAAGYSPPAPADGSPSAHVAPVDGRLVSDYGLRGGVMHYGIDLAAPLGEPIYAVAGGVVIEAGPATGFGLWVRIEHEGGAVTVYGHMHTIAVDQGASVDAGEQIATVGNRGNSSGPHLHLEVWPNGARSARVDPEAWLAEHGVQV